LADDDSHDTTISDDRDEEMNNKKTQHVMMLMTPTSDDVRLDEEMIDSNTICSTLTDSPRRPRCCGRQQE
jgi:hypothetical protein